MPKYNNTRTNKGNVALCYVRWATDSGSSDNKREAQRSNVEAICQQNRWIPEWYEDGFKSGLNRKNRPNWHRLESRLSDLDVVALVANDLSRLNRNPGHNTKLLEHLGESDVQFVLAKSGTVIDAVAELRFKAGLSTIVKEMKS